MTFFKNRLFIFVLLSLGYAHLGQAYTVQRDVTYDIVDGINLKLDIYQPSSSLSTALRPAVIFTHGGCYSMGNKSDIHEDVKKLADAGFTVFSVGYRLSGVAKYPAGLIDVQQALRFIRKNAIYYQVDPTKIASHGESAGGYLAAALGLRPALDRSGKEDEFSSRVQFVVDWFGRTDFTQTQTTGVDCAVSWLGIQRNEQTMDKFKEASLLPYVSSDSAEFLIMHGTSDTQVLPLHSSLLHQQLKSASRPTELVWVEGAGHGFDRKDTWQLSRERLLQFFDLQTKP